MRAAIDEEGRELPPQCGGRVIDRKHRQRQLPVPVIVPTIGEGAQRIAMTALARSTLALVFLW